MMDLKSEWYTLADYLGMLKVLVMHGYLDYDEATKTVDNLCKNRLGVPQ